jgi:DNA-binding HxlR family transcriptional regulator
MSDSRTVRTLRTRASAPMWRETFELASGAPQFRILQAAVPGGWFDQKAAAEANKSRQTSVSSPLRKLHHHGLLERRQDGPRAIYRLTARGEAVREALLHGPVLHPGVSLLIVAYGDASPRSVRKLLDEEERCAPASVWRCAGDFDRLVASAGPGANDLLDDLLHELRALGARPFKGVVLGKE